MNEIFSNLIKKETLDEAFKAKPVPGKHLLEPFKSQFWANDIRIGVMEGYKVTETESEIHKKDADWWYCLEGEAEFICDGELTDSFVREGSNGDELGGKGIANGKKIILRVGDQLWIPAGEAHMWKAEMARMIIVKVPEK